jgi:hypothetical protein
MKDTRQGQQFQGADQVRPFLLDLCHNLDPSTLTSVYHDLIEELE